MPKRKACDSVEQSKRFMRLSIFPKEVWCEIIKYLNNYDIYIKILTLSKDFYGISRSLLNPSVNNNCGLRWACLNNRTEMVRHLIKDTRIDPSYDNNMIYGLATRYCCVRVFPILLTDGKIRPFSVSNWGKPYPPLDHCFDVICQFGLTDVLRDILADERYHGVINAQYGIMEACERGYTEILAMLLADKQLKPQIWNPGLICSIERNQLAAFEMLMDHKSSELFLNLQYGLDVSCKQKNPAFARRILDDDRLTTKCFCMYMEVALSYNNYEIVSMMLGRGTCDHKNYEERYRDAIKDKHKC